MTKASLCQASIEVIILSTLPSLPASEDYWPMNHSNGRCDTVKKAKAFCTIPLALTGLKPKEYFYKSQFLIRMTKTLVMQCTILFFSIMWMWITVVSQLLLVFSVGRNEVNGESSTTTSNGKSLNDLDFNTFPMTKFFLQSQHQPIQPLRTLNYMVSLAAF